MNARLASDVGPGQLPRLLLCSLVLVLMSACVREASPATTPPTVATSAPTTSTTVDRLAEVEAIVRELEERRLDALYRRDLEALESVFSSQALYKRSVPAVDFLEFSGPPPWTIDIHISQILVDRSDCLVIRATFDVSDALGPEAIVEETRVLQPTSEASWGFAYSGDDWLCDGPNPIEESDADA